MARHERRWCGTCALDVDDYQQVHEWGVEQAVIEAALLAQNTHKCQPPLPESEVHAIAASVSRYTPAQHTPDEWPEPQSLDSDAWDRSIKFEAAERESMQGILREWPSISRQASKYSEDELP